MIEFIILIVGGIAAIFIEGSKKTKKNFKSSKKKNVNYSYKNSTNKNFKENKVNNKKEEELKSKFKINSSKKLTVNDDNFTKSIEEIGIDRSESRPQVEILSEIKDEFVDNPQKAFIYSEIFNRKY